MLQLTIIASLSICTFFNGVLTLSQINVTECIKKIQCPMTYDPSCVMVKNKTQLQIKPFYILVLNECEMTYLKCYPDLDAEVVSNEACHFVNESHTMADGGDKMRNQRHTRRYVGDSLGVIEFTSDNLKNENISKLREWSANSLELLEGKMRFAFVVEISRFVEHALPNIRNSITGVLNMVTKDTSKRIKDMVLSVFVYPDYNGTLMTRTDKPKEFITAVDDINCMCWNQGDVQCEQEIYQATVQSLDRAVPGTHMFVFSNSPPSEEDVHYDVEVVRLAQENEVEVTYVVTGDCGSARSPKFQSFYHTAAATKGQVLRIDKEELKKEFLQYVYHTVMEYDRKLLVSSVYSAKGSDRLRVPFTLTEDVDFVTVTISGEDCDCTVHNHKNRTMDYSFNVTTKHVKMYKYVAMEPGAFKIRVHPNLQSMQHKHLTQQFLLTVTTSSIEMMFKFGFSVSKKDTLKGTDAQPAEDTPLYIVVAVREPKNLVLITNVVLLTLDDKVISTYRLIETKKEDVYRTKYHMTIPKLDRMKIKLSGTLRQHLNMKIIERTSTRIIKPYKTGDIPSITTSTGEGRSVRRVTVGQDVTLKCGLPGVRRVTWFFKRHVRSKYHTLGTSRATLVLRSVTRDHAGFYKCKPKRKGSANNVTATYVIELKIAPEGAWKKYQDSCPSKCPVRDVMVCARCQHGVHRTFMSSCFMRMYQCKQPKHDLELVAHGPCTASAPYLGAWAPRPETRLAYPADDDAILQFLDSKNGTK